MQMIADTMANSLFTNKQTQHLFPHNPDHLYTCHDLSYHTQCVCARCPGMILTPSKTSETQKNYKSTLPKQRVTETGYFLSVRDY